MTMTQPPPQPATAKAPTGTLLLRDIRLLVTMSEALGDIADAAVFVSGNTITWVGPASELAPEHLAADQVISLPNHLVHPGMVNTHHHMYQHLTRSVAPDSNLFGWLTSLYMPWNAMTGADVAAATRLASAELLLSGCTTSSDHLYVFPNDVTLADSIDAAAQLGLRFHPTRGAMCRGRSQGGMPPDCCVESEEAALADMERCIQAHHDAGHGSMCRVGLAPCSPFSVTPELMSKAAVLARRYPKVRLHTHLAENDEDIRYSLETYGCRPGEFLRRVGWMEEDVWCAHCVKLDAGEMEAFAAAGVGVSHCPCSNLRLASGIAPVRAMLDTGVRVGLGVDGAASNDGSNMVVEARTALLLQRSTGNARGLTVRETLRVATRGGAACLGRAEDLGQIAPGFAADVAAWRTDTLAFAGAQHDLLGALLLGAASLGPVDVAVVNGRQVVGGGKLLTADLAELVADVNARSARLCALLSAEARSAAA